MPDPPSPETAITRPCMYVCVSVCRPSGQMYVCLFVRSSVGPSHQSHGGGRLRSTSPAFCHVTFLPPLHLKGRNARPRRQWQTRSASGEGRVYNYNLQQWRASERVSQRVRESEPPASSNTLRPLALPDGPETLTFLDAFCGTSRQRGIISYKPKFSVNSSRVTYPAAGGG